MHYILLVVWMGILSEGSKSDRGHQCNRSKYIGTAIHISKSQSHPIDEYIQSLKITHFLHSRAVTPEMLWSKLSQIQRRYSLKRSRGEGSREYGSPNTLPFAYELSTKI